MLTKQTSVLNLDNSVRALKLVRQWEVKLRVKCKQQGARRELFLGEHHGPRALTIEPGAQIVVHNVGKVKQGAELALLHEFANVLGKQDLLEIILLVVLRIQSVKML